MTRSCAAVICENDDCPALSGPTSLALCFCNDVAMICSETRLVAVHGPNNVTDLETGPGSRELTLEGVGFRAEDELAADQEGMMPQRWVTASFYNETAATYPLTLDNLVYSLHWRRPSTGFKPVNIGRLIAVKSKDCVVSEWVFQPCRVPCGRGLTIRSRQILQEQEGFGEECPILKEQVECNLEPCPSWNNITLSPPLPGEGDTFNITAPGNTSMLVFFVKESELCDRTFAKEAFVGLSPIGPFQTLEKGSHRLCFCNTEGENAFAPRPPLYIEIQEFSFYATTLLGLYEIIAIAISGGLILIIMWCRRRQRQRRKKETLLPTKKGSEKRGRLSKMSEFFTGKGDKAEKEEIDSPSRPKGDLPEPDPELEADAIWDKKYATLIDPLCYPTPKTPDSPERPDGPLSPDGKKLDDFPLFGTDTPRDDVEIEPLGVHDSERDDKKGPPKVAPKGVPKAPPVGKVDTRKESKEINENNDTHKPSKDRVEEIPQILEEMEKPSLRAQEEPDEKAPDATVTVRDDDHSPPQLSAALFAKEDDVTSESSDEFLLATPALDLQEDPPSSDEDSVVPSPEVPLLGFQVESDDESIAEQIPASPVHAVALNIVEEPTLKVSEQEIASPTSNVEVEDTIPEPELADNLPSPVSDPTPEEAAPLVIETPMDPSIVSPLSESPKPSDVIVDSPTPDSNEEDTAVASPTSESAKLDSKESIEPNATTPMLSKEEPILSEAPLSSVPSPSSADAISPSSAGESLPPVEPSLNEDISRSIRLSKYHAKTVPTYDGLRRLSVRSTQHVGPPGPPKDYKGVRIPAYHFPASPTVNRVLEDGGLRAENYYGKDKTAARGRRASWAPQSIDPAQLEQLAQLHADNSLSVSPSSLSNRRRSWAPNRSSQKIGQPVTMDESGPVHLNNAIGTTGEIIPDDRIQLEKSKEELQKGKDFASKAVMRGIQKDNDRDEDDAQSIASMDSLASLEAMDSVASLESVTSPQSKSQSIQSSPLSKSPNNKVPAGSLPTIPKRPPRQLPKLSEPATIQDGNESDDSIESVEETMEERKRRASIAIPTGPLPGEPGYDRYHGLDVHDDATDTGNFKATGQLGTLVEDGSKLVIHMNQKGKNMKNRRSSI